MLPKANRQTDGSFCQSSRLQQISPSSLRLVPVLRSCPCPSSPHPLILHHLPVPTLSTSNLTRWKARLITTFLSIKRSAYVEQWARPSILGRVCWLAADQRTASFASPNQLPPPSQSLPLSFSFLSPPPPTFFLLHHHHHLQYNPTSQEFSAPWLRCRSKPSLPPLDRTFSPGTVFAYPSGLPYTWTTSQIGLPRPNLIRFLVATSLIASRPCYHIPGSPSIGPRSRIHDVKPSARSL